MSECTTITETFRKCHAESSVLLSRSQSLCIIMYVSRPASSREGKIRRLQASWSITGIKSCVLCSLGNSDVKCGKWEGAKIANLASPQKRPNERISTFT
ncbi:hypothetical protein POVCU1_070310 [Plasmodium ovale curtisi]|uniref:Uncharacterized protein n=1 Tax=Plasmodium ovale curtisi TaxID=864141 RepID=A0A1A8XDD2_PLAOA|nr:hypothetical protein POVCU1_070310 [Plasmodium ovale curtisi]